MRKFSADPGLAHRLPLTQTIARDLQQMIRTGTFKPGTRLPSQRVLSEQLGVSRASLREALLTLETLGLVQTLPARGTFVADPARTTAGLWRFAATHDIADVFETRILLETELCRLAAASVDPATLAAMEAATAAFEQAWRRGDLVAHVEADLAFHRQIAEACPNTMLRQVFASVQEVLTESQRQPVANTATERMEASIAEHRQILDALRAGDGVAAAAAMRTHVGNTARCAGVLLD